MSQLLSHASPSYTEGKQTNSLSVLQNVPTGSCNDRSPELVEAQQKLLTKHQGLKPLAKKKKKE